MPILPTIGTASYNDVSFDASYKSRISAKMIYDAAGRTVTHTQYDFYFVGIIYADENVSTDIQNIGGTNYLTTAEKVGSLRQLLSHPGKVFQYTSNGFGDLEINTAEVKDVAWGPKPQVVELYPLGSMAAWHLEFRISVCIPECPDAVYQFNLMEFCYEAKNSLDEMGYLTHTYSGQITIPMTRIDGGTSLPDTVDNYREIIVPALLPFFTRTQEFNESMDKRTMTFTIVDKQFPGELPYECLDAEGSHEVASMGPSVQVLFVSTISATYTLAPTADRKLGLQHFMALVSDRLEAMDNDGSAFMLSVRSRESLYKKPTVVSYSCSIRFNSEFKKFALDSGQFRIIPDIDPQKWLNGPAIMKAMGARGQSGMASSASDDVIVDLCNPLGSSISPVYDGVQVGDGFDNSTDDSGDDLDFVFENGGDTVVNPATSWVEWENELTVEENAGTVRMRPLPIDDQGSTIDQIRQETGLGDDQVDPQANDSAAGGQYVEDGASDPEGWSSDSGLDDVDPGPVIDDSTGDLPMIVQKRNPSAYRVTMTGYGIRAGWGVPIPRIKSLGSTQVVEESPSFYQTNKKVSQFSGVPVYMSRWRVTYLMDRRPPAQMPILYDPLLQS